MLIRRNIEILNVDLCWDGFAVFVDYGNFLEKVEDCYGPRTATSIMKEVEKNLHQLWKEACDA